MSARTDQPYGLGAATGDTLAILFQVVFNLLFPLTIISLCGISFALMIALNAPECAFWSFVAIEVIQYARTNTFAAVALGLFVLAAFPLAWVAFKEREIRTSKAILEWVVTGLIGWFIFWLRTVWPCGGNGWQLIAYGVLLFVGWSGVIEASVSTLAIVALHRANRPVKVRPPRQQPHGTSEPRAPRGEPETI